MECSESPIPPASSTAPSPPQVAHLTVCAKQAFTGLNNSPTALRPGIPCCRTIQRGHLPSGSDLGSQASDEPHVSLTSPRILPLEHLVRKARFSPKFLADLIVVPLTISP